MPSSAVVSTSSLDLGVDFKPVDTVIQIGSSKGVARFLQRAGRSGHSPFETSKIYFVPTHSLELIEVAALKEAHKQNQIEKREPIVLAFDVLVQFLVTLAVGEGFREEEIKKQVKETFCFQEMTDDEIAGNFNLSYKLIKFTSNTPIVEGFYFCRSFFKLIWYIYRIQDFIDDFHSTF